jgi:hypothetical protein
MCLIYLANTPETAEAVGRVAAGHSVAGPASLCVCQMLPALPDETRWDHLRYAVEQRLRLIDSKRTAVQGACVVGVRLPDWVATKARLQQCRPLRDTEMVARREPILILRVPVLRDSANQALNTFVPYDIREEEQLRASRETFDKALGKAKSEEAKLALLLAQPTHRDDRDRDRDRDRLGTQPHPSARFLARYNDEFRLQQICDETPEPDYVCYGCLATGKHTRKNCPRDREPNYVPIDHMPMPTGIPAIHLRLVTDPARMHDPGNLARWEADGTVSIFRRTDVLAAAAPPRARTFNKKNNMHIVIPNGQTPRFRRW